METQTQQTAGAPALTESEKWERQVEYWQSDLYGKRCEVFEAQGLTTSDAQACADAEFISNGYAPPIDTPPVIRPGEAATLAEDLTYLRTNGFELPSKILADVERLAEALNDALAGIMEYAHLGASCCDIDRNEQPQFLAAQKALKDWKERKQ